MKGLPARTQGIVASGLMAILVLSVFASSTYTGPESSIYQLHYGLMTGQKDTVRATLLQGSDSATSRELLALVQGLLVRGADVQVRQVHSEGRDAVVVVMYASRSFGVVVIEFFLHKSRSRWQVDTDRTLGNLAARARF